MRHGIKKRTKILLITLAVIVAGGAYVLFRIKAGLNSAIQVKKLEDGLYYMEYNGDYGFDRFLEQGGASSDLEVAQFVGKDLLKGLVIPGFKTGKFGCSTLTARNAEGGVVYGRNFDWMECTAMIVKSKPAVGYASISTVDLDFLDIGTEYDPDKTLSKIVSAASLYAPLDGINEKGLCVAVLMIDDPDVTGQDTGKPGITTTTAVRLLLDQAADVEEAIELLGQYDMHASAGMMLHLALTDRTGRSVAVEYVNNEMSVIETPVLTNFYLTPGDKFGIGTEQSHTRYEILMNRLSEQPVMDLEDMKDAMSSVSKNNFGEFLSTEWTIVYDQDKGEIRYYHRENYNDYMTFSLQ
ncbi:C45 family autoproteolytic acyltransferase/hydolase [Clostridium transplantifaecale]|uniref:C45 family autoproteolytic acyltransferase/hydolase n=1 Tax=Clostridium transplantifaecale TaxID=2479838 RepID=UPI001FA9890B|nr:C45 family peptidase [Clostridium transplantifaecale]